MTNTTDLAERYAPEWQEVTGLAEAAASFVIKSDTEAAEVSSMVAGASARKAFVVAEEKKITDPANATLKAARAFFKPFRDKWEAVEAGLKRSLMAWEGQKLLVRRQAEEAAAKAAAEAAALRAEAEAAEAAGDTEAAQNATEAAAEATAQVRAAVIASVAPMAPTPGISVRSNWKARVRNLGALVDWAIASGQVDIVLQANQSALDGLAKITKDNGTIPGVEFYNDQYIAKGRVG